MRQELNRLPNLPSRPRLQKDDWLGAIGVFLIVVVATFPVVIPFALISEPRHALRVSNGIAIAMLFLTGYAFGRHAGHRPVGWALRWCSSAASWSQSQLPWEGDSHAISGDSRRGNSPGRPSLGTDHQRRASQFHRITSRPVGYSFNIFGYIVPHDRSYASPTFDADRGRVHFGARYNYEDQETGSLWVGYNFSAGDKLALEVTPMIGGVFGNTTGVAPGYKASLAWKRIELSTEGEYVFDTKDPLAISSIAGWN